MNILLDLSTIEPFASRGFCVRLTNNLIQELNQNVQAKPFISAFEKLAKDSSLSQGLQHVLTTFKKVLDSPHQVLYLLWDSGFNLNESVLLGFLKVERRSLYLHNEKSECIKRQPVCLLDFFVHETCQHRGYGRLLFDTMLHDEHILPCMIAVDKPSDSLLLFLSKRYDLVKPKWHTNNFVTFPGFFDFEDFLSAENNGYETHVKKPEILPNFVQKHRQSIDVVEEHNILGGAVVIPEDNTTVPMEENDVVIVRHFDHPDPFFAEEKEAKEDDVDLEFSEKSQANSLAKGRKLLSMAHHKLW